jgi:hypothetical protein
MIKKNEAISHNVRGSIASNVGYYTKGKRLAPNDVKFVAKTKFQPIFFG